MSYKHHPLLQQYNILSNQLLILTHVSEQPWNMPDKYFCFKTM